MNETSEKIHNSSIGIKTKIEFGKIRLCYGLYISKFTKKFSTEKIGLFSKRQKKKLKSLFYSSSKILFVTFVIKNSTVNKPLYNVFYAQVHA